MPGSPDPVGGETAGGGAEGRDARRSLPAQLSAVHAGGESGWNQVTWNHFLLRHHNHRTAGVCLCPATYRFTKSPNAESSASRAWSFRPTFLSPT